MIEFAYVPFIFNGFSLISNVFITIVKNKNDIINISCHVAIILCLSIILIPGLVI